ncbi:MAG: hypothetical protein KA436_08830 [Oligoflexales bacterium]|nr:hypothetical protein [Oligoflexales bacterium]
MKPKKIIAIGEELIPSNPFRYERIQNLKNTSASDITAEELIRIATDGGKKFIKDPIRHRQIEAYRLGYLDL